ncbi:MAG: NirD/YgiW/YdeI family stress tolerance protein [Alphaproteobacteria bacterium]|nr:NirD/YgiW/YdeI family stress tolerance protein [Alphaproteobacteria bacterium]
MKKCSMFVLGAILSVGAAHAEFQETITTVATGPGGFLGGNNEVVTVTQVKEMRDDTPVVLQGYIVQRVGDEKYLFKDSADSITVEIDDDNWRGITITPQDTVKLYGDVDRGLWTTEVDVNYIEKITE